MKKSATIIGMFFTFAISLSYADSFEQHMVSIYSGPAAKPNFKSLPGSIDYRTRIHDGIKQGVNFAGHYAIITFGCGTGCSSSYLTDVKSGKIFNFPLGGEENSMLSLDYHPDSELIKASWDGENETCINQELVLKENTFTILNETKTPGVCDKQIIN